MLSVDAGCSGTPAVLGGAEGTFGVDPVHYIDFMRCSWHIQVEPTKVGNIE